MLTNLFLRCVPQAGTPIERAGHLQVGMALLGNAFELPCPLALLPCELAAGQDLLRLLYALAVAAATVWCWPVRGCRAPFGHVQWLRVAVMCPGWALGAEIWYETPFSSSATAT